MIRTVYKGTDLSFDLVLRDKDGVQFRVKNTSEFVLKLYTTDPKVFVECSFKEGVYKGIIEEDQQDIIIVNSSELEKLDSGLIFYEYSLKNPNSKFDDSYCDEVVKGQTKYFLK